MKKINLTYIILPDKHSWLSSNRTYGVYLGNEIRASFSSEKKVKKFLAETNRFLNAQMQELNQVYIQLFAEYRQLWFVIDLDFEKNIEESLREISKLFNKLYRFNHGANSNFFVYLHFIQLTTELHNVVVKLTDYQKAYDNFIEANRLSTLTLRLNNISSALTYYGKEYEDQRTVLQLQEYANEKE